MRWWKIYNATFAVVITKNIVAERFLILSRLLRVNKKKEKMWLIKWPLDGFPVKVFLYWFLNQKDA